MQTTHILQAWGRILRGQRPSLSIEITRECPLRCPGCYAYDPAHLGGDVTLRQLNDRKGDELVAGILELADRYQPLHLSLVGGDPLVRYRELEVVVPLLLDRGIHVQIVTSAFRPLPADWIGRDRLNISVSIDGLEPEHNARRAPATYERILKNIAGHSVTIHCTITGLMMKRSRYLEEFLRFWTPRTDIRRVWFSLFTPQIGDDLPEMLTTAERRRVVEELFVLRRLFPKLAMPEALIRQFETPPASPRECTFAQTTTTISADLKTRVGPCQFGGNPDCSACGCIASMGLAAVADARVAGFIPVGSLFRASLKIGKRVNRAAAAEPLHKPEFTVIS